MCRDVIKTIRHNVALKQRVTALKVVDALLGKGAKSNRASDVSATSLSRDEVERLIVLMLLRGFIKEDFHFTAFSTISYLVPGSSANKLNSDECKVEMLCSGEVQSQPAATRRLKSSESGVTSKPKPRKKASDVCIVKSTTNGQAPRSSPGGASQQSADDKRNGQQRRKRKVVCESDSDDSNFDFCDVTPTKTRKETSKAMSSVVISDSE